MSSASPQLSPEKQLPRERVATDEPENDAAALLAFMGAGPPNEPPVANTARLSPPTGESEGEEDPPNGHPLNARAPPASDPSRSMPPPVPSGKNLLPDTLAAAAPVPEAKPLPAPPVPRAGSQGVQQQVQGSRRRKAAKPQRADADPDVIKGGGESDDDEGKDGARGPSLLKFAVEFDLKRERPGKYKRALARLGPEAASLMHEAGTDVTEDGIRKSRRVPKTKKSDLYLDIENVLETRPASRGPSQDRDAKHRRRHGSGGSDYEEDDLAAAAVKRPRGAPNSARSGAAPAPAHGYEAPGTRYQQRTVPVFEAPGGYLVGGGRGVPAMPASARGAQRGPTTYSIVSTVNAANVPGSYGISPDGRLIMTSASQMPHAQPQATFYVQQNGSGEYTAVDPNGAAMAQYRMVQAQQQAQLQQYYLQQAQAQQQAQQRAQQQQAQAQQQQGQGQGQGQPQQVPQQAYYTFAQQGQQPQQLYAYAQQGQAQQYQTQQQQQQQQQQHQQLVAAHQAQQQQMMQQQQAYYSALQAQAQQQYAAAAAAAGWNGASATVPAAE